MTYPLPSGPDLPYGVSFLVTLYNKAAFVEQTLEGIIRQSLDCPTEIVICDDGSTDSSPEIVTEVRRRHPEIAWTCFRTRNSGPALATNRAARRARYRYLKPVDADDYLAPGATRLLLGLLERNPQASSVFGASVGLDMADWVGLATRTDWPDLDPALVMPLPLARLRRQMTFGPSGMLFSASAFAASGGCDEDVFVQDYSLALNLSRVGEILETAQPVCYGPAVLEGRLNGSPQLYHDLNLAIVNHLGRVSLSHGEIAQIAARCLGRAIKFQRRHRPEAGLAVGAHTAYLAAKLWLPVDHRAAIERSLDLFGPVRRPKPPLDDEAA